jgi:hypothetical protein
MGDPKIIGLFVVCLVVSCIIGITTWKLSSNSQNQTGIDAGIGFTFYGVGLIVGAIFGAIMTKI